MFALDKALDIDEYFSELVGAEHEHEHGPKGSHGESSQIGHEHGESSHDHKGINKGRKHGHEKLGFKNICILEKKPIDWNSFQEFIDKFNYENKGLVARFKGVIWHRIKESGVFKDYRIVFQGVYGNYQIDVDDWVENNNSKEKLTCMVFIGNLSLDQENFLKSNINSMFIINDNDVKESSVIKKSNR